MRVNLPGGFCPQPKIISVLHYYLSVLRIHWVMDLLNRCNNIFNDISFICMVQRNESKLKYFSSQFSNTSVLTSSRSYNVFSLIPFMYSSHSVCPDLCTTLNIYCSKARGMEMQMYLIKRLFFQFCMLKKILSFENGKHITVETLYNTINFCWSTHKRHSIARPKGRGMGCLLWVQRATYCQDLSIWSSIKYLL